MKNILMSKKVIVTFIGFILAILAAAGVGIPDGMEKTVTEVVLAIVASFNIGQGLADGLSKGQTSARNGK